MTAAPTPAHTLALPDMSCNHCAARVTQAIRSIDPEAHIDIDLAARRVTVGSAADAALLSRALSEAGYPPAA